MSEDDLAGRLRRARERAGHKSATDAARRIGVNVVTYTAHENGGREYDRKAALRYGKGFGVDPGWLMFGGTEGQEAASPPRLTGVPVREVNVKDAVNTSTLTLRADAALPIADIWNIPVDVLRTRLRVDPDHAWIIEVIGDAMYDPANPGAPGSLMPGDRVIVDASDRHPSPPGAFAILDGDCIVLKLVEAVYRSQPQKLCLTNRNPQYRSYEVPADQVTILGRVKGRVTSL